VHPELFRSNDAFRATVLKRYEQVIAEDIATGKDQDRVHAMLRVLALIQPVIPDDRRVLELLASLEGIEAPDASRLARLLIDSGVLFKRGALYRLFTGPARPTRSLSRLASRRTASQTVTPKRSSTLLFRNTRSTYYLTLADSTGGGNEGRHVRQLAARRNLVQA